MGDCGQFNADVSIRYSAKKKEKNTDEEIAKFLKNKFSIFKRIEATEDNIIKAFKSGNKLELSYNFDEEWSSDDYNEKELLEALEEYYDTSSYNLYIYKTATAKDIKYLDLKLIGDNKQILNTFKLSIDVMDVYASIYCENDNSTEESVVCSEYMQYMKLPGAEIVLSADGSGNC